MQVDGRADAGRRRDLDRRPEAAADDLRIDLVHVVLFALLLPVAPLHSVRLYHPEIHKSVALQRGDIDWPAQSMAYAVAMGQLAYYRLLEERGALRLLLDAAALKQHVAEWDASPDASHVTNGWSRQSSLHRVRTPHFQTSLAKMDDFFRHLLENLIHTYRGVRTRRLGSDS